jgi:hypothetical protein
MTDFQNVGAKKHFFVEILKCVKIFKKLLIYFPSTGVIGNGKVEQKTL